MPVRTRPEQDARAAQPVTMTAARVVRPERRAAFEAWATEVQELAATFPGYLGSSTLRPGDGSDEYHLVYRFADPDCLAAWERSPERAALLDRVRELVADERYARADGLESFFTRPPRPGPRWRMTVLTVIGVLLLTTAFRLLVTPLLSAWPWPLQLLLSAVVVVLGLGYVVMPLLTRACAGWLRPGR